MPQFAIAHLVTMQDCECIKCGTVFAFSSGYYAERRKDHKDFFCPNGHQQHYTSESDIERAERLLREEKDRHQRTLERENEERQKREKLERKLKRVDKGVCPECNRTFSNLARHMACKHKEKK